MFFDGTILSSPVTGADRFHYFIRTALYTNIRLRLMTSLTTDCLSLTTGGGGLLLPLQVWNAYTQVTRRCEYDVRYIIWLCVVFFLLLLPRESHINFKVYVHYKRRVFAHVDSILQKSIKKKQCVISISRLLTCTGPRPQIVNADRIDDFFFRFRRHQMFKIRLSNFVAHLRLL